MYGKNTFFREIKTQKGYFFLSKTQFYDKK